MTVVRQYKSYSKIFYIPKNLKKKPNQKLELEWTLGMPNFNLGANK